MDFNQAVLTIGGSASMKLSVIAEQMRQEGKDVINLAGGEPDFTTPQRIRDAAWKALCEGHTHYAIGKGLPALREAISRQLQEDNHIMVSPEQIIMTPGAKFAIYLVLRTLLNPGDEVIILDPSWVSYQAIVKACGGTPVRVELLGEDNYALHEEQILQAVTSRTKAMLINSPNNPTGRVLSEEDEQVLKSVLGQTNLVLISDEIYEKVIFDGRVNPSPASWKGYADRVVTINGFSKCAAMTGWRVGYIAAPMEIMNAMYPLYTHTVTGLSPFIQEACIEALKCRKEMKEMCAAYEERRNRLDTAIREAKNISWHRPQGAFYAWIRFEKAESSEQAAKMLLDQAGIVGVPGSAYGCTKAPYVRLSFAAKDIDKAIERIGNSAF